MKNAMRLSVIVFACLFAAQAQGRPLHFFHVDLSGLNEVPPSPSPGSGDVDLTFDDADNSIIITSGAYANLLAPSTAAHIHMAPAGMNGGVIITLSLDPPLVTAGGLSGGGILTAAQVTALFDGGLYINVHSQAFPGGEIRGQLLLVPTPGALALLGLAGLVGPRRRRN